MGRHTGLPIADPRRMGVQEGDGIEMDTAGVLAQMSSLRFDGQDLDLAWSTVDSEIDADESAIATDELGNTFWTRYETGSVWMRDEAARVAQAMQVSADVGEQCAWFYRVADANARDGMPPGPR